jgi:cysteine desulfurase
MANPSSSIRQTPIYLDHNATTPHAPEVIAAMKPYLEEHFGNPSSSHSYGVRGRQAVERARRQVAELIGCHSGEIVFTSGGTESNNLAIRGAVMTRRSRGRHILTTRIEHPAVTAVCERLRREGFEVEYLPVDQYGRVSPSEAERRLRSDTVLISVMHANNEVGTIQPLAEIAELARARGILFHTDAAQSPGKIPVNVSALGVDLMSLAGHKLYAPKGVGVLYVREGVSLERLMEGAGQERGLRPGTENVLEIVGLGEACALAATGTAAFAERMQGARDRLEEILLRRVPDLRVNGHPKYRLPNTLSVSFLGIDAGRLLERIRDLVAASAGAACHSGAVSISPVLRAMQVPESWGMGTLRFSTGRDTTRDEVETAAAAVAEAVEGLRRG